MDSLIIRRKELFTFFLLFYLMPPTLTSLSMFSIIAQITQIVKYLSVIVVGLYVCNYFSFVIKEYKATLLTAIYNATYLVPYFWAETAIRDFSHIKFLISNTIFYTIQVFLMEYLIRKDLRYTIKLLYVWYGIQAVMNLIVLVILPNGLASSMANPWYFISKDNGLAPHLITAMIFAFLNMYCVKKKADLVSYFVIIIVVFNAIVVDSATTKVGVLISFVLMCYAWGGRKRHRSNTTLNILNVCIIFLALEVGVVFFDMLSVFSDFIVNTLHRDITLSSRTELWSFALEYIANSPIYGYGFPKDSSEYVVHSVEGIPLAEHNEVLSILIRGGMVSFIPFLIYLIYGFKKNMKEKTEFVAMLFASAWMGVELFYFSETSYDGLFVVPVLMANIEYFIKQSCIGRPAMKSQD